MEQQSSTNNLILLIELLYHRCLQGGYGFDSAYKISQRYHSSYSNEQSCIKALIRLESIKSGTSSFIAGIGDVLTFPAVLPVNTASVLFLQMRLIMAIALIQEHDIQSIDVKKRVYFLLNGQSTKTILKENCNLLLNRSVNIILNTVSQKIFSNFEKQQRLKNTLMLCRNAPLIGGLIEGTCDFATTYYIGLLADSHFKSS